MDNDGKVYAAQSSDNRGLLRWPANPYGHIDILIHQLTDGIAEQQLDLNHGVNLLERY